MIFFLNLCGLVIFCLFGFFCRIYFGMNVMRLYFRMNVIKFNVDSFC